LGVERGGNRVGRPTERRGARITITLVHRPDATVGRDSLIEQRVMTGDRHRHRLRRPLPYQGSAVDIGEEERHRPRRQAG
jgi:hypothetical protein